MKKILHYLFNLFTETLFRELVVELGKPPVALKIVPKAGFDVYFDREGKPEQKF